MVEHQVQEAALMSSLNAIESEPLIEPVELTENALATEFTRRHQDDLRYVHE